MRFLRSTVAKPLVEKTKQKRRKSVKNTKTNTPTCSLDKWLLHEQIHLAGSNDNSVKKEEKINLHQAKKMALDNSKTKSKTLIRHPSGSFLKYGIRLPTVEDAVIYKQKLDACKQVINDLELLDDSVESISLNVEEPTPIEVLDCKHLTDEQLEYELDLNYQYMCDIVNGISKSDRHDKFQKEDYKKKFTTDDLKYNTSMITFTFDQKELLLSYLYKNFDKSEFGNNTQYFFKVLLPELCTKIFMDTHNMTYSEATSYLEERPVN